MEQVLCHRCGTAVSREDAFCPACGAPQLSFDATSQGSHETGVDTQAPPGRPGQVIWKDAIGAALIVALPAGILCGLPLLAAGWLLWVMGGASMTIFLYKRKRPMALLNARSGFRIGSLTGLAIAYISISVEALLRVFQRFSLHLGDTLDREYESIMTQSMSVFQTGPEVQAQMRAYLHFMLTPDGRATSAFFTLVSISVTTVFFASLGGYLGVRLFAGRRLA